MGVTIHFEGRIKSRADYNACLKILFATAHDNKWPSEVIKRETRTLARVQNEENWDYTGETDGIEIHPHQNSEPFRFEVDQELFIQEYCKTQFAPIEIHIQLVEVLRSLADHFETLTIFDEGEYFDSSDRDRLTELRQKCFDALNNYLIEHPGSRGPERLKNGRIVDILSRKK